MYRHLFDYFAEWRHLHPLLLILPSTPGDPYPPFSQWMYGAVCTGRIRLNLKVVVTSEHTRLLRPGEPWSVLEWMRIQKKKGIGGVTPAPAVVGSLGQSSSAIHHALAGVLAPLRYYAAWASAAPFEYIPHPVKNNQSKTDYACCHPAAS